jgi:hypothetical protein
MSRFRQMRTVGLLMTFAVSIGCDAMLDVAVNESEKYSHKETDRLFDAALKGPNENGETMVPMSEFFADTSKYQLWAGDPAAFKTLGEKCIAAGATGAYAVVTKDEDSKAGTDTFAFALPTDKAARTKVFDAYNQFWKDRYPPQPPTGNKAEDEEQAAPNQEELDYYLVKDMGQKYITFSYDN